ncbi:MAG: PAS domain S-box protein, partial [Deltaproteobacteria bacterium]|nr:PAS domain S-box protein [Deltaproteobacteria bacterium]
MSNRSADLTELRRQAEKIARERIAQAPDNLESLSPDEVRGLVHELRVHQIELEMQNEELRRANVENDAIRAEYFDLYDLAPVGYLTVSDNELILKANLTVANLFGLVRPALIKQPLTRFIYPENQDVYYHHRRQLIETGEPQVCEMRMLRGNASHFWARLEATIVHDAKNAKPVCRIVVSDITERKRAETVLRVSEARFRLIYEHMKIGVKQVSLTFRIEFANDAFCRMLGYREEELIGKHLKDITHPESIEENLRQQARLASGKIDSYHMEKRYIHKKGHTIYCIIDANLIRDDNDKPLYCLGTVMDITDRKQAEEALRQGEEQYRRLLETMAQGVVYQAANGEIISANPASKRILGLTSDQMMGKTSLDPGWKTIREDGSDLLGQDHPSMLALRTGKQIDRFVMGVFNPEKNTHSWISVTAIPLFQAGQSTPFQVYTTFDDITDRKRAEEAEDYDMIYILAGTFQTSI